MKELGNGFDGTLSKALESSKLASGKPKWLQDYMLAGDFKIGSIKKIVTQLTAINETLKAKNTDSGTNGGEKT